MKQKHKLRWVSTSVGIILLLIGIADGIADLLPYLNSAWLIFGGVILVALGARKQPPSIG